MQKSEQADVEPWTEREPRLLVRFLWLWGLRIVLLAIFCAVVFSSHPENSLRAFLSLARCFVSAVVLVIVRDSLPLILPLYFFILSIFVCVCVCVSYDGEKMLSALDNTGRPGSGSFGALCCCCCCPCCYTACHYAFRHARQGDRDNHHQHFKRIKMINKGTTTQKVQKRSIEKMIQLVFSFRNASLSFNFVWREDSVPCRESFRCVCALYGCI